MKRLGALLAAIHHHHSVAFEHRLAVHGTDTGERGAPLLRIEGRDLAGRDDLVADIDGRAEL